jgi:hypothetical protein
MGPKLLVTQTKELFLQLLEEQINLRHPLIQLAKLIDWDAIDRIASESFQSRRGRPAVRPRLSGRGDYRGADLEVGPAAWCHARLKGNDQAP